MAERAAAIAGPLPLRLVSLAVSPRGVEALQRRVYDRWGVALPRSPRWVSAQGLIFLWAGPERWRVIGGGTGDLERELRDAVGEAAAVVDHSDGSAVFGITGPGARALLARLIPIDLHPRAFAPQDTALTLAGHVAVQIWLGQDRSRFDICVAASYCDYFRRLLDHAGAAL